MSRWYGPLTQALPLEIQRLAGAACRRFDRMWGSGGRPTIELFLEGLSPAEREAVLHELVALEVELRTEKGDCPALGEYLHRFPGDATLVTAAFASSLKALTIRASSGDIPAGPSPGGMDPLAATATEAGETATDGDQGPAAVGAETEGPLPRRL